MIALKDTKRKFARTASSLKRITFTHDDGGIIVGGPEVLVGIILWWWIREVMRPFTVSQSSSHWSNF
jgi:hypothetical protein